MSEVRVSLEDGDPMESAPLNGDCVMIAFDGETGPGYYDDGTDCDGEPFEEPGW